MPFESEAQRRYLWAKHPEIAKRWTKKYGSEPLGGGGDNMADPQFMRYLQGNVQTFNPYGAGRKVYGSGRSAPNVGPTRSPEGYQERDLKARARRKAMLKRLQAGQRGRYMSEEYLARRAQ